MPITTRRRAATAAAAAGLLAAIAAAGRGARAQQGTAVGGAWPEKPILVIVPVAPGGPTDLAARLVAPHALAELGQPFVIENRAGAGGVIGTRGGARAAPDGYTLLMGNPGPIAVAPHVTPNLGYDPLADLEPVATVMRSPLSLVVRDDLPVRSVAELVALIRARPAAITFGSSGPGQTPHLAAQLFGKLIGTEVVVSGFRGAAPAVNAMLAGDIQAGFDTGTALPFVREGKLRALAIGSRERSPLLPGIPTMIESGFPDFAISSWFALFAPARTPPAAVNRLNAAVRRALADPAVLERITVLNAEPYPGTPEEARAFVRGEVENWRRIVARIGTVVN